MSPTTMVHFIPARERKTALLAAQSDHAPVLILGASGTGKGALCRWIQSQGPRALEPLIQATPKEPLLNQILKAQRGTLLLPEVISWGLADQKLLLEVIRTRSLPQEGGLRRIVNVRIIATSSHDLDSRAQAGLFNAELVRELSAFRIEMPALEKRTAEFSEIASGILAEITRELHREHLQGFAPEAWAKLTDYSWPGNLRELRNVLRIAALHAQGDQVQLQDLPELGGDSIDFKASRNEFEKLYLTELLKAADGQIDELCRNTRLDRGTLLTKLARHGLAPMPGSQTTN